MGPAHGRHMNPNDSSEGFIRKVYPNDSSEGPAPAEKPPRAGKGDADQQNTNPEAQDSTRKSCGLKRPPKRQSSAAKVIRKQLFIVH